MQNLLLYVSISAVALTVAAALVAVRCTALCFKRYSEASAIIDGWRSCAKRLDLADDSIAELNARYENLRSRVGMREVRAARTENQTDRLTGEAWKAAKRRELWPTLVPASKPKES